jgi:hypothetical protein
MGVIKKIYKVVILVNVSGFNSLFRTDPIPHSIVYTNYSGTLGQIITKSSDATYDQDAVEIIIDPDILNYSILERERTSAYTFYGYLHDSNRLRFIGIDANDSANVISSIANEMGTVYVTLEFTV